jgi:HlyD family secretion protein
MFFESHHTMRPLLVLFSFWIAVWGIGALPAAAQTPATTLTGPSISVVAVTRQTLSDRVAGSGLVAALERVLVQPQIEGQMIRDISAEVGDRVSAGQQLALLSDSALVLQKSQLLAARASAEAAVAQAAAQQVEARATADEAARIRDRATSLAQSGTISRATVDTTTANATAAQARVTMSTQALLAAQAQVALVDAQIANVDLNLQRTSVTAPVDGVVSERNAIAGDIASATRAPMFVLIRNGALELRADVAEQDILRLAPGQTATLRVTGLDAPLMGTVRLVEPTINLMTRQGSVRIAIETPESVRAGMFAEADILVTRRETLTLPISAVSGTGANTSVMQVRDGQLAQVFVKTGIRQDGLIEISAGLSEGDIVVARAGSFVRDGDKITPILAGQTPAPSTN